MAQNQNPMMGAPMGAGRSLGLPNQFFQGPAAARGNLAQLGGALQGQMAGGAPPQMPGITQGPASLGGMQTMGNLGAQLGAAGGQPPQTLANLQGQLGAAGAPGQGAGGGKGPGGGARGMAPGMQQQIAGLQGGPAQQQLTGLYGGPRPGTPGAPPAAPGAVRPLPRRPGAPGVGPGGQKAPGMQKQIAGLPGGPIPR